MAEPDEDIKPYQDNVWVLKRVGLSMLAVFVALAFAPVMESLGAPHAVVDAYLIAAILLFFAVINWWFLQDRRREQRRRAAIRAQRSGVPIEHPIPIAKWPVRRRMSRYALVLGLLVVSFGLPLMVIGASEHSAELRDLGLALIVLELVVLAIVLPALSARLRRHSRQPTSDNPQP